MGNIAVIAIVTILAGAAAIIFWATRAKSVLQPLRSDRRIELWALAEMRGLVFDDPQAGSLLGMLGFRILRGAPLLTDTQMPTHGADNSLSGDWEQTHVIIADWWTQEMSASTKAGPVGVAIGAARPMADHRTVVWLDVGGFPHVLVRRSGAIRETSERFHLAQRIDFELEAFNRAFSVEADEREAAFAILDARMLQWLLEAGVTPFDIELGQGGILVRATRLLAAQEIEPFVSTALEFVQNIPAHARERYGRH